MNIQLLTRALAHSAWLLCMTSACGGREPTPATPTAFRDSAGIRIVASAAPSLPAESTWTVSAEPSVVIGADESDPLQVLYRVNGAVRLSDGRIVVVNGSEPLVRWYGEDGRYLNGVGREGGGPGEFPVNEASRFMHIWRLPDDSVAVWQHSVRRIHFYGPEGVFVRAVTLDRRLASYGIVGRLRDGFVLHDGLLDRASTSVRQIRELYRDTLTYVRYLADGTYAGAVTDRPGVVSYADHFTSRLPAEAQRRTGTATWTTVRTETPAFGKRPVAWADGDRLYYGAGDTFEIEVYNETGNLVMIIRRTDYQPRLVTDALIAARKAEGLRANAIVADTLPAYRRMLVDRVGALWVQEYDTPGAKQVTWSVFQPDGSWLTDVTVPKSLGIVEIGADYVLSIELDEFDVHHVKRYTLTRASSGSAPM